MPRIPVNCPKPRAALKAYSRPGSTAQATATSAPRITFKSVTVSDTVKHAELTVARLRQQPTTFSLDLPVTTSDQDARARVALLAIERGAYEGEAGSDGPDALAFLIAQLMGWASRSEGRLLSQLLELQRNALTSWAGMSTSEKMDLVIESVNEGLKASNSEGGLTGKLLDTARPIAEEVLLVAALGEDLAAPVIDAQRSRRAPPAEQ